MKKMTLLFSALIFIMLMPLQAGTVNLIEDWGGNGATGAGSAPDDFGWECTSATVDFRDANAGGTRYRDNVGWAHETGKDMSAARQMMLRWEYGYAEYTIDYYSFPVSLDSGKVYEFVWDYCWGNSGSSPALTVDVSQNKDGNAAIATKAFATTANKELYREGNMEMFCAQTGQYYLSITSNTGAWYGATNMSLTEMTLPTIITGKSELDFSSPGVTKSFTVIPANLTESISITAPTGFALSASSVATNAGQDTIEITFNGTSNTTGYVMLSSGDVKDSIYVEGIAEGELLVSETYLTFDDELTTATFTVSGNNLTEDITITAPSGFSVDATTVSQAAGETTITATFDGLVEAKDYITITSSGATEKVRVLGFINDDPFYSTGNLISNFNLNSLDDFSGWGGGKSITTDTAMVYSGKSCLKMTGACGASVDYSLTSVLESNTAYKLRAMVYGVNYTFYLSQWNIDGSDKVLFTSTENNWVQFEETVITGDLTGKTPALYFNSCEGTRGSLAYLDNYELYKAPMYLTESSLEFLEGGSKTVAVTAQTLTEAITITAPAEFSVDTTSLSSTADSAVVTVTFSGNASSSGYIVFTSGMHADSVLVEGILSADKSELQTLVDSANVMDSNREAVPAGSTVYDDMAATTAEAQNVLDDIYATQSTVNMYVDSLNTAITMVKDLLTLQYRIDNWGAGEDVTGIISEPNFDGGFGKWNNPNGMARQGNSSYAGKNGSHYVEKWQSSSVGSWTNLEVSQALKNLPNGEYEVSAGAFCSGMNDAFIFANDSTVESHTNNTVDTAYSVRVIVEDNALTIGYRVGDAGTAGNYVGCDNFRLTYLTEAGQAAFIFSEKELSFDEITTSTSIDVRGLNLNGDVSISAPTTFTVDPTTITVTEGEFATTTVTISYDETAISNGYVVFSTNDFADSIYVQGTNAVDKNDLQALVDSAELMNNNRVILPDSAISYADFALAINSAQTILDDNTVILQQVKDEEESIAAAIAMIYDLIFIQGRIDTWETGQDLSSLISEPSFDGGFGTWNNPNGMGRQANNSYAGKEGTHYVEKWQSSSVGSWTNLNIYQTIAQLPKGVYKLTARAFCSGKSDAYVYADTFETEVMTNNEATDDYSVTSNLEDYAMTIGYRVGDAGTAGNYVGCDHFRLQYITAKGNPAILVSESDLSFDHITTSTSVEVEGYYLTEDISISAPANFMVDLSSIMPTNGTLAPTTVNISFDGLATTSGYVVLSSGDVVDSIAVSGVSLPALSVSTSYLIFDEMLALDSFTVNGGNLTEDITITAPTGFSINMSSIAKDARATTIKVTFDGTVESRGNLSVVSGDLSQNIRLVGKINTITPLYGTTNLISDPYMTDLANFAGWGTKSIVKDSLTAYSGITCAKIDGGSIDATGMLESNTYYHVKAMIKAADANARLGVFAYGDGNPGDINHAVETVGEWAPVELRFATLENPTGGIFFNNSPGSLIDNWQLYKEPIHIVEDSIALEGEADTSFTVAAQLESTDAAFAITTPAGISVAPASIAADSTVVLTVSFDNSADTKGYIVFDNGTYSDSVYVSAMKKETSILNEQNISYDKVFVNNGAINVKITMDKPGNVVYKVYSLQGSLIAVQKQAYISGLQHTVLDATLTSGIYMVNINKDGMIQTYKIVK